MAGMFCEKSVRQCEQMRNTGLTDRSNTLKLSLAATFRSKMTEAYLLKFLHIPSVIIAGVVSREI